MTRNSIISRLALASGIPVIAVSGVLVASAAGGTPPTTHRTPGTAFPTAVRTAHHDDRQPGLVGARHQRMQPHRQATVITRTRPNHRAWHGRCDSCSARHRHGQFRHRAYNGVGYSHSGHRHNGYRHHGYRDSGYRHGHRSHHCNW